MKKILCMVMALMLLTLCPAMAETAVQTQTLVSPDGSYSIEVPADYLPMNAETIMNLFSTEEMQLFLAKAMGLEDASQLSLYFSMIEASNMLMAYSSDLVGNLNVQTTAASLTMDQVVMLKALLDETMAQQYLTLGVTEENIYPMEIQEIGGRRWYGIQLVMAGMDVQTMITVENGVQYTITFTGIDAQEAQSILESFQVAEAAE